MDIQFCHALEAMDAALRILQTRVSPPVKVPFADGFEYRYEEKTLEQALIQKLARIVTGLRSAQLLLKHGLLQEQVAIHRILDEFQQDITFLVYARLFNDLSDLHRRYLEAFYEEELDKPENPIDSSQARPSIPRQKIRAYIADKERAENDPSRTIELTRTLSKAYSGFVHGASPQIMNMYGGPSVGFQVSGQGDTPHQRDHQIDLWNYFYRGLISFAEVASVLGPQELLQQMEAVVFVFARTAGKSYPGSET